MLQSMTFLKFCNKYHTVDLLPRYYHMCHFDVVTFFLLLLLFVSVLLFLLLFLVVFFSFHLVLEDFGSGFAMLKVFFL